MDCGISLLMMGCKGVHGRLTVSASALFSSHGFVRGLMRMEDMRVMSHVSIASFRGWYFLAGSRRRLKWDA